jgi:hypothetical protein
MKCLRKIVFILMAFTSFAANATIFDFSYQAEYYPGTVTGSLSGDLVGSYVQNIADVQVFFNGIEMNGTPLFHTAYNPATDNWDNTIEAFVSADATLNNFLFIDSNYPTDGAYTNYFYMINYSYGSGASAYSSITGMNAYGSPTNGTWSLVARDVPEPATTALLGLGLLGFCVARKRKQ